MSENYTPGVRRYIEAERKGLKVIHKSTRFGGSRTTHGGVQKYMKKQKAESLQNKQREKELKRQKAEAVKRLLEEQKKAKEEQALKEQASLYYKLERNKQGEPIGYRKSPAYKNVRSLPEGHLYPTKITKTKNGITIEKPNITQKDVNRFNINVENEVQRIKRGPNQSTKEKAEKIFKEDPNVVSVKVDDWTFTQPARNKLPPNQINAMHPQLTPEEKLEEFRSIINPFKKGSLKKIYNSANSISNKSEFYYGRTYGNSPVKALGYAGVAIGAGAVNSVIKAPENIYKVGIGFLSLTKQGLKTSPEQLSNMKLSSVGKNIAFTTTNIVSGTIKEATERPLFTVGGVIGDFIAPTIWSKAINGVREITVTGVAQAGLKEVPASDVFSSKTLKSGKLPITKSTTETIKAFKSSEKIVDTFDNIKINGAGYTKVIPEKRLRAWHISQADFGEEGSFASGPAGQAGFQDRGLFVSGSSLSPLRVDSSASSLSNIKLSLNPEDFFKSFKKSSAKGYRFEFKTIDKAPDKVLHEAGFNGKLADFYSSQSGNEKAFITKRSMIGHGELPRQKYKDVSSGNIILERGTIEEEAVFPEGTRYLIGENRKNIFQKVLKAEHYTKYKGQTILLTEGRVLPTNNIRSSNVASVSNNIKGDIVSANKIKYYDASSSNTVALNPFSISTISNKDYKNNSSLSSSKSSGVISSKINITSPKFATNSSSKPFSRSSYSHSYSYHHPKNIKSKSNKVISNRSKSITSSISNFSPKSQSFTSRHSTTSTFSPAMISTVTNYNIPSISRHKKKKKSSGEGYQVEVRKKGKFLRMGKPLRSRREALNKGAKLTGTSASATFRIKKVFAGNLGSFKGKGIMKDFIRKTDRRTGSDVYIEKRGRRIKSSGELREITFKGIQSNKNKINKSFWGL